MIFGVAPSSLAMTPNSLVEIGDGFVEEPPVAVVFILALLLVNVEVECFNGGLDAADVRLDIRGIFVGVSFGSPEIEFMSTDGGWSLTV